jgi:hypothetical protein
VKEYVDNLDNSASNIKIKTNMAQQIIWINSMDFISNSSDINELVKLNKYI